MQTRCERVGREELACQLWLAESLFNNRIPYVTKEQQTDHILASKYHGPPAHWHARLSEEGLVGALCAWLQQGFFGSWLQDSGSMWSETARSAGGWWSQGLEEVNARGQGKGKGSQP